MYMHLIRYRPQGEIVKAPKTRIARGQTAAIGEGVVVRLSVRVVVY